MSQETQDVGDCHYGESVSVSNLLVCVRVWEATRDWKVVTGTRPILPGYSILVCSRRGRHGSCEQRELEGIQEGIQEAMDQHKKTKCLQTRLPEVLDWSMIVL